MQLARMSPSVRVRSAPPVLRSLPDLVDRALDGATQTGMASDPVLPPAQVAEGCEAMNDRHATSKRVPS